MTTHHHACKLSEPSEKTDTACLLVYAAVQCRVRHALQQSQQTYPDQKGKPNTRPNGLMGFSLLHRHQRPAGLIHPSHCLPTAMSLFYMRIPGNGAEWRLQPTKITGVFHGITDSTNGVR
jgi:hypothetical protein